MRITLTGLAVLLLAGCVASPTGDVPTSSLSPTAAPTPQASEPWSTIPVDCSTFFSDADAQAIARSADVVLRDEFVGDLRHAAARQAGVLDCAWTAPGWKGSDGSGAAVFVGAITGAELALQDSWQFRDTATVYPAGQPSWYTCSVWNNGTIASCSTLTLVGDIWVSGLISSGGPYAETIAPEAADALARSYIDRVRAVLDGVVASDAAWSTPSAALTGEACAATENIWPSSGDAVSEGAIIAGLRHCSIGEAGVIILPGGAWAVAPGIGVQNFKTGTYEPISIAGFDSVLAGCGGLGCQALAAVDGSAVEVFLNQELASDLDTFAPRLELLLAEIRAAG